MIFKYKAALFTLLCGVMAVQTLVADDLSRTSVGMRAEPYEAQVERLKQRDQAVAEEFAKTSTSKKRKHPHFSKSTFQKDMTRAAAKAVRYTTHPGAYQNPVSISYLGETIELTDGSVWAVSPRDAYIATNWLPTDLVVITPNHNWFSSHGYSFRFTNQNTGDSVSVFLNLGPYDPHYSMHTHWIAAIDYSRNVVYLEDGSFWKMSFFDNGVIDQWEINDVVIIGVNDGWFSNFNPNILINVNTLNYAAGTASF